LFVARQQGKEPEQPFKGSFNVRTGTDLHRQAALYAQKNGLNLNKVVVEALKQYLPV
jgi:predicted HicB family RNase H-like nuclease